MKKTQVKVLLKVKDGVLDATVPGYEAEVAGLFVHRAPYTEGNEVKQETGVQCWNVSHTSGLTIPFGSGYDTRRDALRFAGFAGSVYDWSQTWEEIKNEEGKRKHDVLSELRRVNNRIFCGWEV